MKINSKNEVKTLPGDGKQRIVSIESYEVCNKRFNIKFSRIKKWLCVLGLSFILFDFFKGEKTYTPKISINEEYEGRFRTYFAEYSLGKIYICKEEEFDKVQRFLGNNDILVIDKRLEDNPDMCVYNSFQIDSPQIIIEVLLALEAYERENPTEWNRSFESMYNEWIVHNVFYSFHIRTDSTAHVDLDNEDEVIFNLPVFSKILKIKKN